MTNTDQQEAANAESPAAETIVTPGGALQRAREIKGLSLEEVASVLRISRSKLIALEADRFDEMPAEAYVRGYIRAYCKLVDLDEVAQITCYEEYIAANQQVEQLMQVQDSRPEVSIAPLVQRFWFVPVIVVALVLGIVLLQPEEVAPSSAPVTTAVVTAAPTPEVIEVEARGDEPKAAMPAVQPEPTPVTATTMTPAVTAPEGVEDRLVLVFTDECWLEVSDAKGDVLAADLKQAGDRVELVGKAPFNVMLGNARAVQVTINDRAVSTEPQGNNRALRLQVE